MAQFNIGEEFSVTFLSSARYGEYAGTGIILGIERINEEEIKWQDSGAIGKKYAVVGKITYKLNTKMNSKKVLTSELKRGLYSKEWLEMYGGEEQSEYFSPEGRSYSLISTKMIIKQ